MPNMAKKTRAELWAALERAGAPKPHTAWIHSASGEQVHVIRSFIDEKTLTPCVLYQHKGQAVQHDANGQPYQEELNVPFGRTLQGEGGFFEEVVMPDSGGVVRPRFVPAGTKAWTAAQPQQEDST